MSKKNGKKSYELVDGQQEEVFTAKSDVSSTKTHNTKFSESTEESGVSIQISNSNSYAYFKHNSIEFRTWYTYP